MLKRNSGKTSITIIIICFLGIVVIGLISLYFIGKYSDDGAVGDIADEAALSDVEDISYEAEDDYQRNDSITHEDEADRGSDDYELSPNYEALKEERAGVWEDYSQSRFAEAQKELEQGFITYGEAKMRFVLKNLGNPEGSYMPLYIAMHGGGSGETAEFNDEQWEEMQSYYTGEYDESGILDEGIYIAVRGVRDTWDTHFNPESYPIYDRLIEDCILVYDIDPNRVYLEGFSAGGDGVYAIAPRMADRFAAANMSSGHPNDVSFVNMMNLPIQLQVGETDDAYDRNLEAVRYDDILNEYGEQLGGYEHRTLIHYDCGHNYEDYARTPIPVMVSPQAWRDNGDRTYQDIDSFPPDYMLQFSRNPYPETVIWDLSTRASERNVESFYYLKAPLEVTEGMIIVQYEPGENRVVIDTDGINGDFSVLFNEDMIDFEKPVEFVVDGSNMTMDVMPYLSVLEKTTAERGDPFYQFEAEVSYSQLAGQ